MKIALLALSGIRTHDLDLPKLGPQLPSLGLLYLAACTPAGHEVRYFETESEDLRSCDLAAIDTCSALALTAYAIGDRLRAAGVKTVLVGQHASALPDEALAHADFVLVGEGENVWPVFVRAVTRRTTQRLWNAADYPTVEARWLPVPRYDLLGNRPYPRLPVQTARACRRPVVEVIRDLRAILRLRKRPCIEFTDDNTFADPEWGKELCCKLMPLRVKWFASTDLSVAADPELLLLLRQARCRQLRIGLDCLEAPALEAIRRIQAHGIAVNGCVCLGLDHHTPDVFEQVLEFVHQAAMYEVQLTVPTPFPGTPLHDRLQREGRILQPNRWDLCTLFDVNYRPLHLTIEELRQGLDWLTEKLCAPEAQRQRRLRFFADLWRQHDEELTPAP